MRFMCSLCKGGVLGGALFVEDTELIYRTQKLTVPQEYKRLVIKRENIRTIEYRRMVFPLVIIQCYDGDEYTFIVFRQKKFKQVMSK